MRILPRSTEPRETELGAVRALGATWDGRGVHFAVFSENATDVQVCLFDRIDSGQQSDVIELARDAEGVWRGYGSGIGPGQLYGFRAGGAFSPSDGHRFDSSKLLLDPYAKAMTGALAPQSVLIDPTFDWEEDQAPRVPWSDTLIYECHVKGLTARHPKVGAGDRGKYQGMCSSPIVEHLQRLGVTTVELLPVHHSMSESRLVRAGLSNYWGYNTIGFFAPDARFASGDRGQQVVEFKGMVRGLHRAGIEVILDVVYNHTAETDESGPTLCFRGLDNRAYYHLDPADPRRYLNFTGCGNTLNVSHPACARLVLDSLRYWVEQMHVDGFRFDLASALARGECGVDPGGAFFASILSDPVLREVKLIVEPWDAAPGGYQLGRFPRGYTEWNDRYRDTVRRFWRGDAGQVAAMATRLAGSGDCFTAYRGPLASVNFVASHDGFTLHDLVSYDSRHNEGNLEENRDGTSDNASRNWGVEGPTGDPGVRATRERIRRGLLATLAFSQGVPMLCAGDEMGRTQQGNNNAYCQDNEVSWVDWELDPEREALLHFTARLFEIRRRFPQLRRSLFFLGAAAGGLKDVTWLRPDGGEMNDGDWTDPTRRAFGVWITAPGCSEQLLLALNGSDESRAFAPPDVCGDGAWRMLVDSGSGDATEEAVEQLTLGAHSLRLLARGLANMEGTSD